jgi:DNA polymerase-4/DNA polymerase V
MPEPFTLRSYPRAILHVDGDCFFASCEIAKNPALRGKAVVTGKERGIVSSMSYEAKARGVTRAMSLSQVRKICPDVVILPSDYETYSLYSERMYEIVKRYTPEVEEYSIDECFADLGGMRRANHMSYEDMAIKIKHELDTELGMTFSVGLSVNKVLAKVASKWKKPSGLTFIPGNRIHEYLERTDIGKIWGIGPNTTSFLRKFGVKTALDLALCDRGWVSANLSKPFQEIYEELRGGFVNTLVIGQKHDYASISKTKTFTPASAEREFVFSQLSKNIENACIKLRRHHLFTKRFSVFLKTQEFHYSGLEIVLAISVCVPREIISVVRERFQEIFKPGVRYRATGVVLMELTHEGSRTYDLFGHAISIEAVNKVYEGIDHLSEKFGKHTVFLGSSFQVMNSSAHHNDRAEPSARRSQLLKGETARKRIRLPYLGVVV